MNNKDHLDEALEKAANLLVEHCDSVRIFVSVLEADKENARTLGRGSWYAQCWQVQCWLDSQRHQEEFDD